MTVLVSGAAGLIGRFVVKELTAAGEDVISVDISQPTVLKKSETFEKADIGDALTWVRLLTEYKPTSVIHLGAMITHNSHTHPIEALRVNVMGTGYLFEAAKLINRPRIVYASTVAVYGPPSLYEDIVDEDTPVAPGNIYGATKAMDEAIAAHYRNVYGMEATGMRPTLSYGPGRYAGVLGEINRGIRNAVLAQPVNWTRLFAPGVIHNPIHASDIARAFTRAATGELLPSPVYNIGGIESLSEDEIIRIILEAAPQHGPFAMREEPEYLVSYKQVDCSRFHRDANFSAKLSFNDAVKWSDRYYNDREFRAEIEG